MGEAKNVDRPRILLWDVRKPSVKDAITQEIFAHGIHEYFLTLERRVVRGLFHPKGNTIISLGIDKKIGFIDYLQV
jgi:hypothetical protein